MGKVNVESNTFSHFAAISICEKGGMWQYALDALGLMDKVNVVSNIFSY